MVKYIVLLFISLTFSRYSLTQDDVALNIHKYEIDYERLLAKNNEYANLLRAVQIANNTIWKYTDYRDWENDRILNPRPKYNIYTGETVGRNYNCYEYTNIIEMLLTAMKSLQKIKDLPDADRFINNFLIILNNWFGMPVL